MVQSGGGLSGFRRYRSLSEIRLQYEKVVQALGREVQGGGVNLGRGSSFFCIELDNLYSFNDQPH